MMPSVRHDRHARRSAHRNAPVRRRVRSGAVLAVWCMALVAALSLQLGACAPGPSATVRFERGTVRARLADTTEERSRGLRGASAPAPGEGMLFAWPTPGIRTFTIEGVAYDIDVIFIGEADGEIRVVDVTTLSPDGARIVTSPHPARWGLEVPGGWAAANGVERGSAVEIEPR